MYFSRLGYIISELVSSCIYAMPEVKVGANIVLFISQPYSSIVRPIYAIARKLGKIVITMRTLEDLVSVGNFSKNNVKVNNHRD